MVVRVEDLADLIGGVVVGLDRPAERVRDLGLVPDTVVLERGSVDSRVGAGDVAAGLDHTGLVAVGVIGVGGGRTAAGLGALELPGAVVGVGHGDAGGGAGPLPGPSRHR